MTDPNFTGEETEREKVMSISADVSINGLQKMLQSVNYSLSMI